MSVQTQIDRIKANIASAYAKAQAKGAELPAVQNSENLPATIAAIPDSGLPEGLQTIAVTADPPEGGNVSGGGIASVGMTLTVKADAAQGHNFNSWRENDAVVSEDASYTFTVAENRALTAVFTEIPASRLPEGYTELEYIQIGPNISTSFKYALGSMSMADSILYLDFDIVSNSGMSSSNYASVNNAQILYGGVNVSYSNRHCFLLCPAGSSLYFYSSASTMVTSSTMTKILSYSLPKRVKFQLDYGNSQLKINDEIVKTVSISDQFKNVIYLGSGSGSGTSASSYGWVNACVRIREVKFSSISGTAISHNCHHIPAKNQSGHVGFYDIVNDKWLHIAIATAGPAV